MLLTVRGRKSGQPRTTPVDLFEGSGRSFLISTHRQESSSWCAICARQAKGSRRPVTVVELAPEAAGKVLKEVLGPRLAAGTRSRPSTHLSRPTRRTTSLMSTAMPRSRCIREVDDFFDVFR